MSDPKYLKIQLFLKAAAGLLFCLFFTLAQADSTSLTPGSHILPAVSSAAETPYLLAVLTPSFTVNTGVASCPGCGTYAPFYPPTAVGNFSCNGNDPNPCTYVTNDVNFYTASDMKIMPSVLNSPSSGSSTTYGQTVNANCVDASYTGTGMYCIYVPVGGTYRVSLSFDYTNNSTNQVGEFSVDAFMNGNPAWQVFNSLMMTQAGNGNTAFPCVYGNNNSGALTTTACITVPTTSILAGATFHQTLTNTVYIPQGTGINVLFQGGPNVQIIGGFFELMLISYTKPS